MSNMQNSTILQIKHKKNRMKNKPYQMLNQFFFKKG